MIYEKVAEYLQQIENNSERKTLRDLPDPFEMKNLQEGVKKFINWIDTGKKILIVGDYDADGIMATTIIINALQSIGLGDLVDYYIPLRLTDGYGLSVSIIEYAKKNNFNAILTVDNGISAVEAIKVAKENKIEVIVTDHHTVPSIIPDADIIINPKQKGETFPFVDISGATVAWYFIAGLKKELNLTDLNLMKYIDFVAITIISDVMPIKNINIPLLEAGLKKIKNRDRYLYNLIWNDWTAPVINETSIAFQLVPLINAIGRLDNAKKGVELFLSKNKNTIEKRLNEIKAINDKRKTLSSNGLDMAIQKIKDIENKYQKSIQEIGVVFIRDEGFHEGIVGIIAGKISEKYNIPTYVFSWNKEKQIWKGSGRTANSGVHLYDFTNTFANLLVGFGGHKGAAGLAISDEKFDEVFDVAIKNVQNFPKEFEETSYIFDVKDDLLEINQDLIDLINRYRPYGEQKHIPEFKGMLSIKPPFKVIKDKHLKCNLVDKNNLAIESLFFNLSQEEKMKINDIVKLKKPVNVSFSLNENYDLYQQKFNFNLIANL